MEICKEHERNIEFICVDCQELVCPKCMTSKHRRHAADDFDTLLSSNDVSYNSMLTQRLNYLWNRMKEYQNRLDFFTKVESETSSYLEELLHTIDRLNKSIKTEIVNERSTLVQSIHSMLREFKDINSIILLMTRNNENGNNNDINENGKRVHTGNSNDNNNKQELVLYEQQNEIQEQEQEDLGGKFEEYLNTLKNSKSIFAFIDSNRQNLSSDIKKSKNQIKTFRYLKVLFNSLTQVNIDPPTSYSNSHTTFKDILDKLKSIDSLIKDNSKLLEQQDLFNNNSITTTTTTTTTSTDNNNNNYNNIAIKNESLDFIFNPISENDRYYNDGILEKTIESVHQELENNNNIINNINNINTYISTPPINPELSDTQDNATMETTQNNISTLINNITQSNDTPMPISTSTSNTTTNTISNTSNTTSNNSNDKPLNSNTTNVIPPIKKEKKSKKTKSKKTPTIEPTPTATLSLPPPVESSTASNTSPANVTPTNVTPANVTPANVTPATNNNSTTTSSPIKSQQSSPQNNSPSDSKSHANETTSIKNTNSSNKKQKTPSTSPSLTPHNTSPQRNPQQSHTSSNNNNNKYHDNERLARDSDKSHHDSNKYRDSDKSHHESNKYRDSDRSNRSSRDSDTRKELSKSSKSFTSKDDLHSTSSRSTTSSSSREDRFSSKKDLLFTIGKDGVYILDLYTYRWTYNAVHENFEERRYSLHSVVEVGKYIYVFGGSANSFTYSRYELKGNPFEVLSQVPLPYGQGGEAVAACYDGERYIYLLGGMQDSFQMMRIDQFDTHTKEFNRVGQFDQSRYGQYMFYHQHMIYTLGTFSCATPYSVDNLALWAINPVDGSATEVMSDVRYRKVHKLSLVAMCFDGEEFIYILDSDGFFYSLSMKTSHKRLLCSPFYYVSAISVKYTMSIFNRKREIIFVGGKSNFNQVYSISQNIWKTLQDNDKIDRSFQGGTVY